MKRLSPFNKVLAFLLLAVLFLTACTPAPTAIATSQAVQIPLELKMALNGAILFVVLLGLQWVFDRFGLDLRGWGAALAATAAEFLILQFQGMIDFIPAQYDLLVTFGLNVLLALLTLAGFARALFQRGRAMELFTNWRGK